MSALALPTRGPLDVRPTWALALVYLGGLLVRLPALARDLGVTNDVETLRGWLHTIAERGPVLAYAHTTVNYPPVYIDWLWLAARLEPWLARAWPALDGATLLVKLPALAADVLTAIVIGRVVGRLGPWAGVGAAAAYLFNPAVWYVSSYWGQVDAVYALFLVLAVGVVQRPANWFAWVLFALALSTKPQALCLAPVLVLAAWRGGGWRSVVLGGAACAAALGLLWAPWLLAGQWAVLRSSPLAPLSNPLLSITAYNLWYLLRIGAVAGFSAAQTVARLPLTYETLARLVYLAVIAGLLALVWRRPLRVALLAAAFALAFFVFMPDMRERYLFPAPALLLLALAGEASGKRRWLWLVYVGLSLTWLFNLVTIASPIPGGWVNLVSSQPVTPIVQALRVGALVVAALHTLLFIWLVRRLSTRRGGA